MQDKFKIIDESGDRRYFTIIPNYIVNHSSAYEQSLYLTMKRIAGENGTCFASPKAIGKTMGVSENTVKKYRKYLLKRGWIELTGKRKSGKTSQMIDEYKIIDLWKFNTDYYTKVSLDDTLKVSPDDEKVSTGDGKVSPVAYEEEPMKKKIEEDIVASKLAVVDTKGKEINDIIGLFKEINPSYEKFYKNTTQRRAIENLLKKFPAEQIKRIIEFLPKSNKMPYCPTITTPLQLEDKVANLAACLQKEKIKLLGNNKIGIV